MKMYDEVHFIVQDTARCKVPFRRALLVLNDLDQRTDVYVEFDTNSPEFIEYCREVVRSSEKG